ncbi:hypothetical protein QWA_18177 [Alcaligenes faecalis subsp. faecalis NCIB 8687]|nr:hypothetical protein QWA_18177 [Alcaligenes faecalis subsp. faecalis NCIB 8687]
MELDWEQGCEQFLVKIPRYRLEEVARQTLGLRLDWEQGCEQFLVKIPRYRLEEVARQTLGLSLDRPIEFAAGGGKDGLHQTEVRPKS